VITQAIDQDGGCTLVEALGLLEFIKMKIMLSAGMGKGVVPADAKKEYHALKARRIAEAN